MKFKITDRVKKNRNPTSTFEFVIELMGGDADASFYPTVLVDENNPYLERFVKFLENCKKAYPNGKGGYDDYSHVEDYWLFIEESEFPDDISKEQEAAFEKEVENCGITFFWESNYEYFGESSFVNYRVLYYDENGIKHNIEIEF
ncbi:hypothetical protein N356_gp055 [Cellulophaga phage phi14:2]|uniref:Uncharacterized protein n=1 Tax=Cellulophaga phage phi14:2 TaxID=1327990 RepID=S0A3D5_9CAUD|nr:hypothetical protein N356_gp055 [Cellulophaga phage phi14:2]AGO48947.1 hypothetical protein Phi14:2_gp069 [Cellulophaga phage phi14:2]